MAEETVIAKAAESQTAYVPPEKMDWKKKDKQGFTQHDRWQLHGHDIEAFREADKKKPEVVESAPQEEKVEVSSEKAPIQEIDDAKEIENYGPKAQKRIKQLVAQKKQAEERAKQAEEREKAAAAERVTPKAEEKQASEEQANRLIGIDRPVREKFDSSEKYEEALIQWGVQQRDQSKQLLDRVEAVNKRYPGAKEKIIHAAQKITANMEHISQPAEYLGRSPLFPELLNAMSEKVDQFIEKAKADPVGAIQMLHVLEAEIGKLLVEQETDKDVKAEEKEEAVPREPKKKITEAPAPPREIGGKASASEDPIRSGVANATRTSDGTRYLNDSFTENANKRDLARRQRGR